MVRKYTPPGEPWLFVVKAMLSSTDECIDWPYNRKPDGYARMMMNDKSVLVARYICTKMHGPPPNDRYEAAHSCDRGAEGCINWIHLSWKTRNQNVSDRARNEYNTKNNRRILDK
jgi:hypothetical protein